MDSNVEKKRRRFRYRGSLVGPIILITIGAVFLLNNMGYLSGDVWDVILKLWPLLFVAIGLDNVLQGRGVTGPLLFIGIGIVILLNNFGFIGWNLWELLLKLWPIFLIAIGLDLIIGRRSVWGAILAIVILIVILIAALWYFGAGQGAVSSDVIEVVQQLNDANQAIIVLKPVVAGVSIGSLSSSENLLEGTINQWMGETVEKEYQVVDGKGDFSLYSEGISSFQSSLSSQAGWDLDLINSIPLTLDIGLGVGEIEVDMQSMMINEFTFSIAVGKIVLTLPSHGHITGKIENPIGSIRINIPPNTGLRLSAETGLTNIQVPPDYGTDGNIYISPGFSSVENQVDLIINQAIGLVTIEEMGDR